MKEILKVELVEDKKTTKGKSYARCKTSIGWVTCWNEKVTEALKNNLNTLINAETETNEKGYKSIKGFEKAEEQIITKKPISNNADETMPLSMLVAYAKDIFNVMQLNLGEENEVKKAEKLEYYADYSAMLVMRMKRKIEQEIKLEKLPVEEEDEEIA